MSKDPLFVERRADGKYTVKHADAQRVSAVTDTQKDAILRAQQITDGPVHVERVRYTDRGSPDKWRKP